jgi:hypothetical protein
MQQIMRRAGITRAVFEFRKMWVNGSTLRVGFMGGDVGKRDIVMEQAGWWSAHANLRFQFVPFEGPGTVPDADIRIAFDERDGAWSWIGTDCKHVPQNEPTMNLGFMHGGTAAHEFGHAIGLGHEHQNPAGGIEWNEEVVIRDLSGPPNYWSEEQIRHNVLNKYSANQIRGTTFDPDSLMLYWFPASWTKNGMSSQGNETLSGMDKAFIAGAQAYPKVQTDVVELTVNARLRTVAHIGKPGEEDLFFFKSRGGRHLVETRGPTDVIMKLFGPEVMTRLIAEDDDSGVNSNARIVADLIPGNYWVQIRHYRKATGTGTYSIGVKT